MFRAVCPTCTEPSRFDDSRDGREVECPRCRTPFVAKPDRRFADEHDAPPERPRSDGSGYATLSLILGIVGLVSTPCCVGLVFGLGGLLAGYTSLQSRMRGLAIVGMVLSLAAIVLSIGIIGMYLVIQSSVGQPAPPGPDGTEAPFVKAKK